jgi:uncharacterized membrane protein YhaH (DUF805 family)
VFTVRGRTNRGRYWLTQLLLWVSLMVFVLLGVLLRPAMELSDGAAQTVLEVLAAIVAVVFVIVWIVLGILLTIRRLHDRDKSGHWIWLFYVLPSLLNGIARAMHKGAGMEVAALLILPALAIAIWGFIEIGCLRGTVGPNRFGPDPLQVHVRA